MSLQKIVLVPYKLTSKSCSLLQSELKARLDYKVYRVARDSSSFKPKSNHVAFNYGCSSITWEVALPCINSPNAVSKAGNKARTFEILGSQVPMPEFTKDPAIVREWLSSGHTSFARTVLNGHSGQGIVHIKQESDIVPAGLYTKYTPKETEYRVHVFDNDVVDIQQKRKRSDFNGEHDMKIRNHHTGWVYCRESYVEPICINEIKAECIKAVKALGLHFGAVDVIYSKAKNKFWILEVNTAPGMEGKTVTLYADSILKFLEKV